MTQVTPFLRLAHIYSFRRTGACWAMHGSPKRDGASQPVSVCCQKPGSGSLPPKPGSISLQPKPGSNSLPASQAASVCWQARQHQSAAIVRQRQCARRRRSANKTRQWQSAAKSVKQPGSCLTRICCSQPPRRGTP